MTWTPVHVEISAGHGSIIGARDGTLDRDFNAVTIELSNYVLFLASALCGQASVLLGLNYRTRT
jgi:hypothetical protein